MGVGKICSRDVVFARRNESVAQAAHLMREHHVGTVVVVDERNGRRFPVGMLTDRDIAVGVVALGADPAKSNVEGAMPAEVVCVRDTDGLGRAVALMRAQGVRRLPVIDASGALVGVLSADDVLEVLAEELYCLGGMMVRGERYEREHRKAA
ncbi:MAG: CBS domain-containing protein [Betaproteobacteria bacterium]|nr:MAG: CBS domain-containing protein [Betaproteobacteria bacterium]